jgi:hypothetical protein
MELLEGMTLRERILGKPLPTEVPFRTLRDGKL